VLGLATVRKVPPRLELGAARPVADDETLEALIANRYEVMARYARGLRRACASELRRLKEQGTLNTARIRQLRLAKRWLPRDEDKIPSEVRAEVAAARAASPMLDKLVVMREELRSMWTRTNVSAEQLVADLQAWCRRAEESGIASLQEFAVRLRMART
jgi:stearoyl-CoA desaturase (delta-9 desaturase)